MGRHVRKLGLVVAFGLAFSGPVDTARGEIKEYQIRRMLMLKTECGVSGLDISKMTGSVTSGAPPAVGSQDDRYTDRFRATCENVAYYPDGVEIVCPDTEDEQDCRLLTRKREFPHLKLFQP